MMVRPSIEKIRKQHEELFVQSIRTKKDDAPLVEAFLEEVKEFVRSVALAGAYVSDTRQRSFLQALIDYWRDFIKDKTGTFPPLDPLKPCVSSQGKIRLSELIENPSFVSIDNDKGLRNLAKGYWVYDELLRGLVRNGWVRFAPGYKSALYGKDGSKWCIKVLGMGVGKNPLYFCERGYYLEHERKMLQTFKGEDFTFQPDVMSQSETIEFLTSKECGISQQQAELRALHNDVLITEYIGGIPFATQTGYHVDYVLRISITDESLLREMYDALVVLKEQLDRANEHRLRHNDLVPPNIIFTLDKEEKVVAKLVDFETAQDLNTQSPDFIANTVKELYRDRHVPMENGVYTKTLDEHLISEDLTLLDKLIQLANSQTHPRLPFLDRKLTVTF